jgi:uncharacterized protein (DUF1015 family)
MATVRPFKGFRPLPEYAAQVAAKPYDVLSSEEARREAQGKPLSFLHVGKPEIDLPPGTNLYDSAVYEKGKENLQKLIRDGILKEDPEPRFYVYAQTMGNHTQCGIIGCASVREYLDNTIRKHELTRQDKEDDRTRHVRVTNAHTGPIFLTYYAEPKIDAIVDRVRLVEPLYNFVADDGIRHQLWVISDERLIRQLVEHFSRVNCLYVADGHHRSAAAARVGKEIADANPDHRGDEEYNFFLAVLFPHNQLRIMEYNRVVRDLNGYNELEFLAMVQKQGFIVRKAAEAVQPKRKGEYAMYLNHMWHSLTADLRFLNNPDPVQRLDVSILQTQLLAPLLAIDDPRTNKRIDFVGGIRGIKELEKRVESGEMAVAFALYPTSIEELLSIADAGKIMPPKSTWFEPKLRDGIVIHFLS